MEQVKPEKKIRLSKSCIGDAEKEAVMGVLDREYLGMGAEVQEFENTLSEYFGRPVVCVVNGTAALHLALQACGVGAGDEVLVQSLTYIGSYQAISAAGARPVSCDVYSDTLTINLEDAEKRVTAKTKAIMPVHYAGGVGALDRVYAFAEKHNLRVIEDAAHAFGSTYKGAVVGGVGDIACFSFDGIKNITSGEGGCIVTTDEAVLAAVKDARLLGVVKDSENRYEGKRSWSFDVLAQGWRYHMSNIMAALGLAQLSRFEEFALQRKALARRYLELLQGNNRLKTIVRDLVNVVPHIFPIVLPENVDRSYLRNKLSEKGIETGVHYQPNHLLKLYRVGQGVRLDETEKIMDRILTLPLHPDMDTEDVDKVVSNLLALV